MIEKTFASGNYNSWEEFIKETLPAKNNIIRESLIPCIDQILESMLGVYSTVHKTSVDITPVFDEYLTIKSKIVYSVEDFEAPDVPVEAVKKDIQSISKSLTEQLPEDVIHIDNVDIDVNTGNLTVETSIAVKF